jgi:hypothetical protein
VISYILRESDLGVVLWEGGLDDCIEFGATQFEPCYVEDEETGETVWELTQEDIDERDGA